MRGVRLHIYRSSILLVLFSLFIASIYAQNIGVDTLDGVTVVDSASDLLDAKLQFSTLEPHKKIDQKYIGLYQLQSIDQLLQAQTSTFIKNYGFNNLSTISIRGTSATQSQVVWHGIPINSAATGYTDLSLLNTGLFDQVDIQYGGASTLYGSGAIGGAVQLRSRQVSSDFLSVLLGMGSYRNYKGIIKAGYKRGEHQLQVKVGGVKGRNNFPFLNRNKEKEYTTNAGQEQLAATIDYHTSFYLISRSRPLMVQWNSWGQYDHREIPPSIFEHQSAKLQSNNAWRNALTLRQDINKSWSAYLQSGAQFEQFKYSDSLSFQDQKYNVRQFNLELGLNNTHPAIWHSTIHRFLFFLPFQSQSLLADHSGDRHKIYRGGIAAAYLMDWKDGIVSVQTNLRKEFQEEMDIPFLYGVNVTTRLLRHQSNNLQLELPIFFSIQNSYRIPTLNELYYFPGGNEHLLPESGDNLEVGLRNIIHFSSKSPTELFFQASYFRRDVSNWIYWLGSTIWTPYNIAEVHSTGWDFQMKLDINTAPIRWLATVDYAYTIATTSSSYLPSTNSIGRQIPYTPRYLITSNVGLEWGKLFLNVNHQYTGYRFTNLDESAYLPPYHLVNCQLRYYFDLGKSKILSTQIQIQNALNTRFESVKGRPMPPMNWILSVSMSI